MQSRTSQAVLACLAFAVIALLYGAAIGVEIDVARVTLWSAAGVLSYIGLSRLFGFDPHRTRIAEFAPALLHYVDRWELRLGQATLSMLGCVVIAARLLDETYFVTAVVSGTLSAWMYFVLRWYSGGYRSERGSTGH